MQTLQGMALRWISKIKTTAYTINEHRHLHRKPGISTSGKCIMRSGVHVKGVMPYLFCFSQPLCVQVVPVTPSCAANASRSGQGWLCVCVCVCVCARLHYLVWQECACFINIGHEEFQRFNTRHTCAPLCRCGSSSTRPSPSPC